MTKEDALFFLGRFRTKGINEKLYDALGVAIEALNAQTEKRTKKRTKTRACDLISRQYLVEHVKACMENDRLMKTADKDEILQMIADVPSAEPKAKPPKWVAEDRYVKNRFAVLPHCPQCNAEVTTGQCYCMICGQHIDWSEDEG